jgi:hemoglobin/transferrin/lactoferrin receptor protein
MAGAAFASADDQGSPGEAGYDQIVVVANKDARPVREIAGEITVIRSGDIEAQFASSFSDLFRYMPGIDHEGVGTRFGTEGVSIRGIGGNRVALEIDGVPLPEQFDIGNFSNATRDFLDAGFVEQVEILRGPASALYGSSAIGGVVAVRTPMPEDLVTIGTGGGLGRIAYSDADRSYAGQSLVAAGDNRLGFIAGASWRSGEDADAAADKDSLDNRSYRRRSAIVKVVGEPVEGHEWQVGVRHQQTDVESDLKSMLGSGRFRSTTRLEGDDASRLNVINARYTISPTSSWLDRVSISAYRSDAQLQQDTLDERLAAMTPVMIERRFSYGQVTDGVEVNLQSKFSAGSASHQLGIGVEWQQRRTDEMRHGLQTGLEDGAATTTVLGESFPVRDFPLSRTQEWGAYIEDAVRIGRWTAIAAIRTDTYDLDPEPDTIYREDNPYTEVVSIEESEWSPKFGLIYHWSDATDIYLQYARGFRAPPFEDANIGLDIPMFNIRAIPNPDLRSETSDGVELGARWQGASTDLRLSLFRTRYDDFIETKVRLGADPATGTILFQSQNISEATIEGVEARLLANLSGGLNSFSLEASASLSRGDNEDTGLPLNSVGPGQAVVGARWTSSDDRKRLRLLATMSRSASRLDESSGELYKPAGYAVVDLLYSQQLSDRVRVDAGLFNLLDKTYWNWADVRGFAATDPVINTLSRPGRGFSLGLHMNW